MKISPGSDSIVWVRNGNSFQIYNYQLSSLKLVFPCSPHTLCMLYCVLLLYILPFLILTCGQKRLSFMPFLQKTSLLARPLHGTFPCLKKSPLTKINGSAVQLEGSPFHLQVQHLPLMHIRFNVTVSVVFFYL